MMLARITIALRSRWFRVAALVVVAVALCLVLVAGFGYYPIAFVNNRPIFAREFDLNYRAAMTYYARTGGMQPASLTPPTPAAVGAAVLDQIVVARLVDEGVRAVVSSDLDGTVQGKVAKYRDDTQIAAAAQALYGLAMSDFEREVLIPQAERDILAAKLFFAEKTFDAWLKEARQNAQVIVLSGQYRWDGGQVTNR
jgi:hypothetical protein